ncbi:Chromatin associated protein [Mycena chlorophos]|uniref:Chromatin associated protein n=1 Tax=Mycena chlorophos TaxID=658473 RepID=A0A8H6WFT1_MYCCL|nr:Chromatin associated protein [Mycena chlorophos]
MASGGIYQHRALGPAGVPQPDAAQVYSTRGLADTLDRVKTEFDMLVNELTITRDQRDRFEATVNHQTDELEKIKHALHELEAQHNKVRMHYEHELRTLRDRDANTSSQRQTRPSSAIATLSSPSIFQPGGASAHSPVLDPHNDRRDRESRERPERDLQRARFLDQGATSNKRIKLDQPQEPTRLPLIGPGSSPSSRRAPTPVVPVPQPPPPPAHQQPFMNDFLNNIDLPGIPSEFKKEGSDWFVLYNPKVKRTLDVSLIHSFLHETVVCCIQFSNDGKYLATGCNRTAQIFDVNTGRKICVLSDDSTSRSGDLYIRSVRFSPDGRYLATGAEDERIRIWDIEKQRIRIVFEGHRQDIYSLDFSLDGRRLVSGSGDTTVRIWDMEDHSPARVLTATPESDAPDEDAGVMAVAISPDGSLIAAGCVDALVRVWSTSNGNLVDILRGHQNSVHSVVFTRDGAGIVSGALDNTIRCWDLRAKSKKDGVPCAVFAGHKDYVLSVGISRDAQWIVSGSKDRGVHFWDQNGVVQCMLQGHKNSVISTSLHPHSNYLATGSGDKVARIWSYTSQP